MRKILLIVLLGLLSATAAQADLSYTQKSTYNPTIPQFSNGLSKVSIKNDITRVDINFFGNPLTMLTQPNGIFIQIDPNAKIYTLSTGENDKSNPKNPTGAPVKVTASVKKLGIEKLNGIPAQRWQVKLTMPFSETNPPQTMNMTQELWSSTTPSPLSPKTQDLAINDVPVNIRAMVAGNARVVGDLKGMRAAFTYVPLRLKTSVNGMQLAVTQTSAISTKPLPVSLFSVPAGYKKISFRDWTKLMNDTTMKKLGR